MQPPRHLSQIIVFPTINPSQKTKLVSNQEDLVVRRKRSPTFIERLVNETERPPAKTRHSQDGGAHIKLARRELVRRGSGELSEHAPQSQQEIKNSPQRPPRPPHRTEVPSRTIVSARQRHPTVIVLFRLLLPVGPARQRQRPIWTTVIPRVNQLSDQRFRFQETTPFFEKNLNCRLTTPP